MANLDGAKEAPFSLAPPPLIPSHGSAASLLAHQGSGVPLLSHQGSGVPLLPRQGSGIPPLPRQGSGVQLLPHQGSGVPLLHPQGSLPAPEWATLAGGNGASGGYSIGSGAGSSHVRLSLGPALEAAAAHREEPAASVARANAAAVAAAAAAEGGLVSEPPHENECQQEPPHQALHGHSQQEREREQGQGQEQQAAQHEPRPELRQPPAPAPPAALHQPSVPAMLRMAAWVALLFVGYGFQRGLCAGGIPYDCDAPSASQAFSSLTMLAFVGGGMGWLAGVTHPARFAWLAAPRRAYLWLLYLAVLPAYSGISSIPALRVSLAGMGAWGPVPIALKAAAAFLVLAALAFHIWLAWRAGGCAGSSDMHGGQGGAGKFPAQAVAPAVPSLPATPSEESDSPRSAGSRSISSDAGSNLSARSTPSSSPWKKPRSTLSSSSRASLDNSGRQAGGSGCTGSRVTAFLGRSRRPRSSSSSSSKRLWAARWRSVALYLLPRLAVLAYFAAWLVSLPASGAYSLHLHHYALGWGVAIFAAFNHPVSGLVLALATAVFVQGAGAYGFDPIFKPVEDNSPGCLTVSSPPTGQMTCSFWSATPFDIGFCSNTSWIPWFDCNVKWPWPDTDLNRTAISRAGAAAAKNAPKALSVLGSFVG